MKFASPCVRFAGNLLESIYLTLQFDGMNHFMQFTEPPLIAIAFIFICILPNTKQQFVHFQLLLFMLCEPRARHGVWIWNFSCLQNKQENITSKMMKKHLALPSMGSSVLCEIKLMARGVGWIRAHKEAMLLDFKLIYWHSFWLNNCWWTFFVNFFVTEAELVFRLKVINLKYCNITVIVQILRFCNNLE